MKFLKFFILSLYLCGCSQETIYDLENKIPLENSTFSSEEKPLITSDKTSKNTVKITKYFDFDCPFCQRGAQVLKALQNQYGDQVEIELMNFVVHPSATNAHKAMECAREQGKVEQFFYSFFLHHYGSSSRSDFNIIGQEIDLNLEAYNSCQDSDRTLSILESHRNLGALLGVRGTPYYIIDNEIPLTGAPTKDQFENLIKARLN